MFIVLAPKGNFGFDSLQHIVVMDLENLPLQIAS